MDLLELEELSAWYLKQNRKLNEEMSNLMQISGWGQGSDGHNVAISHPEGRGLKGAMANAFRDAKLNPH